MLSLPVFHKGRATHTLESSVGNYIPAREVYGTASEGKCNQPVSKHKPQRGKVGFVEMAPNTVGNKEGIRVINAQPLSSAMSEWEQNVPSSLLRPPGAQQVDKILETDAAARQKRELLSKRKVGTSQ